MHNDEFVFSFMPSCTKSAGDISVIHLSLAVWFLEHGIGIFLRGMEGRTLYPSLGESFFSIMACFAWHSVVIRSYF